MVSIEVDEDADVNGADGGQDTEEGHAGQLVDKLHPDEHHEAKNEE